MPDVEIFFAGRRGSIEERVVAKSGRPFLAVPSMGLRRGFDLRNAVMPFVVGAGYLKALAALAPRRPDAAVGTGGFISLPPILAARTLRVPVVLQEQNSYPGLATRILSRLASAVHVSFEETRGHLPHARAVLVSGNPVRGELGLASPETARRALGLPADGDVVLVIGGSRGARRINEAVAAALPRLADAAVSFVVQTGEADVERVREAAEAAGVRAVVAPFFDDMASAYGACDLVVSRAGATALAEMAVVGRPSILVPYPFATEGHQMKNARAVERAGAALVVPDDELDGDLLAERIRALLTNRDELAAMADAAKTLARPDAADRVARAVLALAGSGAREARRREGASQ